MPRLILFAPCEKVLMEQTLNRVCLVTILDDLQLTLGTSEIPENAVLPLPWAIFALWKREESDAGKEFEQQCELVGPDGKRLLRGAIRFQLERPVHRTTINFPGL